MNDNMNDSINNNTNDSINNSVNDSIDDIVCEGMLKTLYAWIPITCIINVDRETEKAVHGTVTVKEGDEELYKPIISWVPRSMSTNPWFICTKIFDEERRVSNHTFENNTKFDYGEL